MAAGLRRAHDRADVAVVGSGMGGAVASTVLAEAGLKVVCLEQGPWTRPEDHPHDDPDWEWRRLTSFSTAPSVRRLAEDYPLDTRDETSLMWNAVGGSTVVYTATWPRFRPSDFRKGTEHGWQPDWPFTYEDLGPWYERNDRDMGVAGLAGDPARPPRGPFQTPPVAPGPLARIAGRGFDRLGWHWWPMPVAIIAEDYDGRLACNNCGNCQSGCPRGSLGDVSFTHWPKAIAAGADLRPNCRVERIETGPDGRASGVVYVDRMTGTRHMQPADVVIVAANGIGSPRLLLMSESGRHPNGLANGNDLVGRYLMHHGLSIVEAWVDERTDTHKGIVSAALICEEFAETDPRRGFLNGCSLHIVRLNGAGYQALGSHSGNTAPWGAEHHATFRRRFAHGFGILCVGDDLPLPDNRVMLSATETDSSGLPAPKIEYRLHTNDQRLMDFAVDRAVDLAKACDAFDVNVNRFTSPDGRYAPPAWHLLGTCRMGSDPETSVTNQWGQTWDVPNLFVMDGSLLPTGGAVNPTSTIGAVVLRAASHLRDTFAEARVAKRTPAV
ncbi:MAG: GMC family oxidoreductase [Thermomicrobiales bacterium]|nr:GMC family oxidoreductase [Thermomicrobiales bacterium]